mmetsp:Transcript_8312/g.17736  ORF Transcript_8312/g.17736 Transcript_8312/m.17736 type:complete len:256 (+) Transcript_8312:3348-4115(+)
MSGQTDRRVGHPLDLREQFLDASGADGAAHARHVKRRRDRRPGRRRGGVSSSALGRMRRWLLLVGRLGLVAVVLLLLPLLLFLSTTGLAAMGLRLVERGQEGGVESHVFDGLDCLLCQLGYPPLVSRLLFPRHHERNTCVGGREVGSGVRDSNGVVAGRRGQMMTPLDVAVAVVVVVVVVEIHVQKAPTNGRPAILLAHHSFHCQVDFDDFAAAAAAHRGGCGCRFRRGFRGRRGWRRYHGGEINIWNGHFALEG